MTCYLETYIRLFSLCTNLEMSVDIGAWPMCSFTTIKGSPEGSGRKENNTLEFAVKHDSKSLLIYLILKNISFMPRR